MDGSANSPEITQPEERQDLLSKCLYPSLGQAVSRYLGEGDWENPSNQVNPGGWLVDAGGRRWEVKRSHLEDSETDVVELFKDRDEPRSLSTNSKALLLERLGTRLYDTVLIRDRQSGQTLDIASLVPENTLLFGMPTEDFNFCPSFAVRVNIDKHYWREDLEGKSVITYGPLNTMVAVASLGHEVGHAWDSKQRNVQFVHPNQYSPMEIEELIANEGITEEKLAQDFVLSERNAWAWQFKLLRQLKERGFSAITDDAIQRAKSESEISLGTYDMSYREARISQTERASRFAQQNRTREALGKKK